jgi:hypothetical protein
VDSGSRPARRYRLRRSGLAPVAVQLAVPVALGLLIGGVLAYQAGSSNNMVIPRPLGAVATPTPSFGQPSAPHGAVEPPSPGWIKPSPSTTAATTRTTTTTTTTNFNCVVIVPANPPNARRTLSQLTGGMTPAGSGCP